MDITTGEPEVERVLTTVAGEGNDTIAVVVEVTVPEDEGIRDVIVESKIEQGSERVAYSWVNTEVASTFEPGRVFMEFVEFREDNDDPSGIEPGEYTAFGEVSGGSWERAENVSPDKFGYE